MRWWGSDRTSSGRAGAVLEFNLVRKETGMTSAQQGSREAADERAWITERGGVRCMGINMIVDLHGAQRLDELALMEQTLRRCADAGGATLLNVHLHRFEPNGGIAGTAVLAESHIAVHSWPERNYAAFDIFMCGKARPERCIEVLLEAFNPRRAEIQELLRGPLSD